MAQTNATIKKTREFKTLLAVLKSEDKALKAYKAALAEPAAPALTPLQELVAAGFTEEQAQRALAAETPAPAAAPVVVETPRSRAEALVEAQGFDYAKGRVYGGPALAEAIVRVYKTGKPEIVASSGVGRTAAVVVYKPESGDVAMQNLVRA